MHKKFFSLLNQDPAGGNGNPPPGDNLPVTGQIPPPVAATVAAPRITEREADLQAQIDVLKAERDNHAGRNKKLETDIAHLQDKLNQLQNPKPPTPAADDRSDLQRWMDGDAD